MFHVDGGRPPRVEPEEAAKQRQCRLIEFILIHGAHSSSVTERYESPLLICLSWKRGG